MHLDRRTVSRKTPRDGKLEVSAAAAIRMAQLGGELHAEWQGVRAPASMVTMTCTCGGDASPHEHFFLECAIFRTLPVGEDVSLALHADTVRVAVTPST